MLRTGLCLAALMSPLPVLRGAEPKSGYLTTSDGVRLHYLQAGAGPSILFVPGWTMPAEIWEPQIRHFATTHRVIAVDPRSQGRSEKTAEGHYPERRSRDYKELVDRLKLKPAVLVGWSLGVSELLTYVDQFGTDTLRAIVLVDGNIGADPDPKLVAARQGRLDEMQKDRAGYTARFVRSMYKKPHAESYYRQITDAALRTPTNTAFTLLGNLFMRPDFRPILPKMDRPLLYVVTPQLKAQAEMLRQRLPAARVEVFEESGHALFADEPERFNRLLEDFLRSSPPR